MTALVLIVASKLSDTELVPTTNTDGHPTVPDGLTGTLTLEKIFAGNDTVTGAAPGNFERLVSVTQYVSFSPGAAVLRLSVIDTANMGAPLTLDEVLEYGGDDQVGEDDQGGEDQVGDDEEGGEDNDGDEDEDGSVGTLLETDPADIGWHTAS